ncbi:hypothetical protein, partial [Streptococcus gordonii]
MNAAVKLGAVILIVIGLMMFTGKLNTISTYMSASTDNSSIQEKKNEKAPATKEESADDKDEASD